jgi:hypothetical protein
MRNQNLKSPDLKRDEIRGIRIFDSGPGDIDRYTIILADGQTYGMGSDVTSPQGYNQYVGSTKDPYTPVLPGRQLGKRIKFNDLPLDVQAAVKQRT